MWLVWTACANGTAAPPRAGGDAEAGRLVYSTTCTACHNADPSLPGPIGPEVKGASRALLEARVLHGKYPDGYTPKRDTALMQPLPQLATSIDDLEAYLR